MPNAPLIIETALLLLAAFLIGCVAGYLLRRLATGKPGSAAAQAAAAQAAASGTGELLVVAPKIAPLAAVAPKRTPAQRLAAAAMRPEADRQHTPVAPNEPVAAAVVSDAIQPAREAGQTTSGRLVPTPVEQPMAPEVAAEEPEAAVIASEVPPIDEAVHVLDPHVLPKADETGPAAADAPEISWSDLSGMPDEEFRSRLDAESEQAAMRAIEGGWTPRTAPRARPVELPEPIKDMLPAEANKPEPEGTSSPSAAEVAGALSAVRSAVAAASAAAEAALAEHAEPSAAEAAAEQANQGTTGEPRAEGRGHAPFGRPAGLAAPREGGKDDLRRIKGMTPQAESALNALGIFHFDQIAAWDRKSAVWIDSHLALKGGLARDRWIEQARDLAKARTPFRAVGKR